jgi:hypothetical protein
MKEQRASRESKHFVLILDYPVLMMCANTTEGNLLIIAVDFFHKGFMHEGAIVGVIMFDMPICLRENFLKCLVKSRPS